MSWGFFRRQPATYLETRQGGPLYSIVARERTETPNELAE